jgi:hypothetical protein
VILKRAQTMIKNYVNFDFLGACLLGAALGVMLAHGMLGA